MDYPSNDFEDTVVKFTVFVNAVCHAIITVSNNNGGCDRTEDRAVALLLVVFVFCVEVAPPPRVQSIDGH